MRSIDRRALASVVCGCVAFVLSYVVAGALTGIDIGLGDLTYSWISNVLLLATVGSGLAGMVLGAAALTMEDVRWGDLRGREQARIGIALGGSPYCSSA